MRRIVDFLGTVAAAGIIEWVCFMEYRSCASPAERGFFVGLLVTVPTVFFIIFCIGEDYE